MKSPIYILLTILFLIPSTLFGGEIDSLEQILPSLRGIEKIDMLNNLSRLCARDYRQKSVEFSFEALELSKKINYRRGEADALIGLSTADYHSSDYHKAIEHLTEALIITEELNDSLMIFDASNKLAINYRMTGKFEESLAASFRALQISELLNDTLGIARMLNNIGGIYKELMEYSKALEYYTRADEIYSRMNNLRGLAQTTNNIGIIHRTNGNYETALIYYKRSLDIERQLNNRRGIAQSLNNIGSLYSLMGNYDQAIESFRSSLTISGEINNPESQSVSLNFLGETYFKLRRYTESEKAFDEMLSISDQTGNVSRRSMAINQLARISVKKGDFRKAVEYYEKLTALRDSLHQEQIKAIVAEIEAKYEFEKKAKEIENLKQENKIKELKLNTSRLMMYGMTLLLIIALIIAQLLIQRNKLRTGKKNAELEQKLFRTQMNPHFIFNALNTIQSFIIKNNPADAGKYLSSFARLIRLVLTNSRQEFVSLKNEISTLEYYLQLQQLRYENKFTYNIIIDPAIHPDLMMVPPMLAQPFIENSIEHGIQGLNHPGYVNVSFKLNMDSIFLEIEDNGIGITQSQKNKAGESAKHESLALAITQERLKLLNQSKKKKIIFQIKELLSENMQVKGTAITFSIPFHNIEKTD